MVDNSVLNELKTMIKESDIDDTTALRLIITGQIRIIEKQDKIDDRIVKLEGFIKKQEALEKEVVEMKKMKNDVDKNTDFRKKEQRIRWVIAKYVIGIITLAVVILIATAIASQG